MIQEHVIMRRCILNYLEVNCQNVYKLTSNVLKTEVYLYVYVCLCAYIFIYMYVFIEKESRHRKWWVVKDIWYSLYCFFNFFVGLNVLTIKSYESVWGLGWGETRALLIWSIKMCPKVPLQIFLLVITLTALYT